MKKIEKNIKLNIMSIAVPALVCVIICSFILSGMTFSWFTDSLTSNSYYIRSGSFVTAKTVTKFETAYNLIPTDEPIVTTTTDATVSSDQTTVTSDDETVIISDEAVVTTAVSDDVASSGETNSVSSVAVIDNKCTLEPGTYFVTLDAAGATTEGFVTVKLNDTEILRTVIINGDDGVTVIGFTVEVTAENGVNLEFVDSWNKPDESNLPIAGTDGSITADGAPFTEFNITKKTVDSAAFLANNVSTYSYGPSTFIVEPAYGYIYDTESDTYFDPNNPENSYKLDSETGYLVHEGTGVAMNPANGNKIDAVTGYEIDGATGYLIDSETGCLIHDITSRLMLAQTVVITEGDISYETVIFIDVVTGYEIQPETGYLIEPITLRLIDAETGYYVLEGTEFLIIPETSYLYNSVTATYHDPLTFEEVSAEVALGVPTSDPADDTATGDGSVTDTPVDTEEIDDPEIVEDEDETIEGDAVVEGDATPDDQPADETVYFPLEGFYNIPDNLAYQIVPYTVEDEVYGTCRMLYNTVDGEYINLTANAAFYLDPTTGFYRIPDSTFQIVPSTGYLYDTVTGFYFDPLTLAIVSPEVALEIVTGGTDGDDQIPETNEPEVTDPVVTEPTVTEPEVTTQPDQTTQPESTTPVESETEPTTIETTTEATEPTTSETTTSETTVQETTPAVTQVAQSQAEGTTSASE